MFGDSIFSQGDRLTFQRIIQEAILNHGTNPIVIFNVVRATHAVGNTHYQHEIKMTLAEEDYDLPTSNDEIIRRIVDGKQAFTSIFKNEVIGNSRIGLMYSGYPGKFHYLVLTENTKTAVNVHMLTDNPENIDALVTRFAGIQPVIQPSTPKA